MVSTSMGGIALFSRIPGVTLVSCGFSVLLVATLIVVTSLFFVEGGLEPPANAELLACREDGTPVILDSRVDYNAHLSRMAIECRDVTGAWITVPTDELLINGVGLQWQVSRPNHYWKNQILKVSETLFFTCNRWSDGRGFFQVFDRSTNFSMGFIGASGFMKTPPPVDLQFPICGAGAKSISYRVFSSPHPPIWRQASVPQDLLSNTVFLWTDDSLVNINLSEGSVQSLVSWTAGETVQCIVNTTGLLGTERALKDICRSLVVKTSQRFIEVDPGKNVQVIPLPVELENGDSLRYYGRGQKGRIFSRIGPYVEDGNKIRQIFTIYTVDDGGNLVSQQTAALLENLPDVNGRIGGAAFYTLFGITGVVMLTLEDQHRGMAELNTGGIEDLAKCYPLADRIVRERKSIVFKRAAMGAIFSFLLALFAFVWDRDYHGTLLSQVVWFIYVFLFGLPGLIGYLTHRKWPARLPCVYCGTKMPVTSTVCPKCSTPVPLPARTKNEIFA